MKTRIIRIGNSKGLRLSKTIIDRYEIGDSVILRLEEDCIVIEPLKNPRSDWDEAFAEMKDQGGDELLMPDVFDDESLPEWK